MIKMIIISALLILVIVFGSYIMIDVRANVNYIQCCNGSICTDTYWTQDDNLCHYSLCEHNLLSDKTKCTYLGANVTMINNTMV
jgi:hypothetical protein